MNLKLSAAETDSQLESMRQGSFLASCRSSSTSVVPSLHTKLISLSRRTSSPCHFCLQIASTADSLPSFLVILAEGNKDSPRIESITM